jgi:hypothetical protein
MSTWFSSKHFVGGNQMAIQFSLKNIVGHYKKFVLCNHPICDYMQLFVICNYVL